MVATEGRGADARQQAILHAWFGSGTTDVERVANQPMWFGSDPELDRRLREQFSADIDRARRGDHDSWRDSPLGCLAFILLVDQFPRNVYRGTPRAFALDPLAQEVCTSALQRGLDRPLSCIQRVFCYMPLVHSEDVELHRESGAQFDQLVEDGSQELSRVLHECRKSAHRHAEIIERFGRYPHRNAILGRSSTAEEIAFLVEPDSSF